MMDPKATKEAFAGYQVVCWRTSDATGKRPSENGLVGKKHVCAGIPIGLPEKVEAGIFAPLQECDKTREG
jgi:hypothetical protein